ncbi:chemotaxis protein CheW [Pseudomonas sp. B21-032]|uniref:chemotaxis protein CheW n=1 Tax=unclassified Pseudomonas TaxID=196821 RepID=UPI0005EAF154|nr:MULTISPECIES: chemotaxis protein CheW [unclassified Pseudomonas]KJK20444.1 chemotaxis protein CheW [Pseudomonas sp. 2(2015)]QVM95693.1 purine-binding chemotaxis protein CheW [Pseudomonas sp. SORT22]UVL57452.1 chemotaxis protein CheW [Pseudomonas sp. B21-035]UVL62753.1 chemotaxis protein CheW [Pseudomonas sp. B21-032]SDQ96768.1 chemotaxis-related protein WspB [Pseudomonas sp. UC 17F4]
MNDLQPRRNQDAASHGTLYLVFRIGDQRFALDAHEVAEVLPRLPLKPIAQTPAWVAGVLAHRGALVPVIDVGALSFGLPAPVRTSTRLVLVHYRADPLRPHLRLGLILEQATDTLRCDPAEFQPYGLDNQQAPYLGPVREDAHGLLQCIGVQDLLSAEVRQLLFPPELAASDEGLA